MISSMSSENLAGHLRKICFALILACVGLLIALSGRTREELDKALIDIDSMQRAAYALQTNWLVAYINKKIDETTKTYSSPPTQRRALFHFSQNDFPPRLRGIFADSHCIEQYLILMPDQQQMGLPGLGDRSATSCASLIQKYHNDLAGLAVSTSTAPPTITALSSTTTVSNSTASVNVSAPIKIQPTPTLYPNIEQFRQIWNGLLKINTAIAVVDIEDHAEITLSTFPAKSDLQKSSETKILQRFYVRLLDGLAPQETGKREGLRLMTRPKPSVGSLFPINPFFRTYRVIDLIKYSDGPNVYEYWPSPHKFEAATYSGILLEDLSVWPSSGTPSEKDFRKLRALIPVKTVDVPLNPIRDLGADMGASWPAIPFELEFGRTLELLEIYRDLPFERLKEVIKNQHETLKDEVEVAGLHLRAKTVVQWGAVIVAVIQLYLYLHLRVFSRHLPQRGSWWQAGWIALYDGSLPKFVFLVGIVILPIGTEALMLFAGFTSSSFSSSSLMLLLGALLSVTSAGLTLRELLSMWRAN